MVSRNPVCNDGDTRAICLVALLQQIVRPPDQVEHDALFAQYVAPRGSILQQCRKGHTEDPYFGPIVAGLKDTLPIDGNESLIGRQFRLEDGLLFFRQSAEGAGRLCVPHVPYLRDHKMNEVHDSVVHGHSGVHRTIVFLSARNYWRRMAASIQKYISL